MPKKIGPGLCNALLETFTEASSLLPEHLKRKFILVGGTAMISLGSDRETEDVDFVITPESLFAFEQAAALDPRFSKDSISWSYHCVEPASNGFSIEIEFL
jgi:hypothetical protein